MTASTMDPQGMGVEMEGGKPGWNDAMNGLPGLLGSGMPETYETLRILRYVHKAVKTHNRGVSFPVEFSELLDAVMDALATYEASSKDDAADHAYWDATNVAREDYRAGCCSPSRAPPSSSSREGPRHSVEDDCQD